MEDLPAEIHLVIRGYIQRKDAYSLARTSGKLWQVYRYSVWRTLYLDFGLADKYHEHGYRPENDRQVETCQELRFPVGRLELNMGMFSAFIRAARSGELDNLLQSIRKIYIYDSERGIAPNERNVVCDLLDTLEPKLVRLRTVLITRTYEEQVEQPRRTKLEEFASAIDHRCDVDLMVIMNTQESEGIVFPKEDRVMYKNISQLSANKTNVFKVMQHHFNMPFSQKLKVLDVICHESSLEYTPVLKTWTQNVNHLEMFTVSALNMFDGPWWIPSRIDELYVSDHPDACLPGDDVVISIPFVKIFGMVFDLDSTGLCFKHIRLPDCQMLIIDPTELDDIEAASTNVRLCMSESFHLKTLVVNLFCEPVLEAFIDRHIGQQITHLWIKSGLTSFKPEGMDLYRLIVKYFPRLQYLKLFPWTVRFDDDVDAIWHTPDPAQALRTLVLDRCVATPDMIKLNF